MQKKSLIFFLPNSTTLYIYILVQIIVNLTTWKYSRGYL